MPIHNAAVGALDAASRNHSSPPRVTRHEPREAKVLKFSIGRIAVVLIAAAVTGSPTMAQAPHTAEARAQVRQAEASISARFTTVRQLTHAQFDTLTSEHPVTLVDVRDLDEFAISHLRGAIRVAPGASAEQARRAIGPVPHNGAIVLYCTIGFRSSRMAERIREVYGGQSGPAVANLRGGVIAWANAGRPLVNAMGATHRVHPYDTRHARMLIDPPSATGRLRGWP
jgi:rhodanese-related sulfurtransferase